MDDAPRGPTTHTLLSFACPVRRAAAGRYASTGFELLGLALVNATGKRSWREYDQMSVFPPDVRADMNGTAFPGPGPCSNDPLIAHQYATWPPRRHAPRPGEAVDTNITVIDIVGHSCLNGWTCGNIAATPRDIARFHWDLHHLRIVNATSLAAMVDFLPMRSGWNPQMYGLATMQSWPFQWDGWEPDPTFETKAIGHAGADYGQHIAPHAESCSRSRAALVVVPHDASSAPGLKSEDSKARPPPPNCYLPASWLPACVPCRLVGCGY